MRRGATDPTCGMKVDKAKAVTKEVAGQTLYFCSQHCLHAYEAARSEHVRGGTDVHVHPA